MRELVARYAGQCYGCGSDVHKGDRIGWQAVPRGRGRVFCGDCVAAESRRLAAVEDDRLAYYGSAERADAFAPSGW